MGKYLNYQNSFLIIILYSFFKVTPKTVTIPFFGKYDFVILLNFGNKQNIKFQIGIDFDYSWLLAEDILEESSKLTFENETKLEGIKFSCSEINESLAVSINNKINVTLSQLVVSGATKYENAFLGLAYKLKDERFSFIHQLKKQKLIKHLYLTISPKEAPDTGGKLFFGEVPSEIKETFAGKCKVVSSLNNWGCQLNRVLIDDYVYMEKSKNTIVKFSTIYQYIFVPFDFFEFLQNNVFDIDNNVFCDVETSNLRFSCSYEYFKEMNHKISFVLDNYKFSFELKDLFSCINNQCFSHIISTQKKKNSWIFGTKFFIFYNTTFDFEKGNILFYGRNHIEIDSDNVLYDGESKEESSPIKTTIFIIIGIGIIILLFAVYLQCSKIRKRYSFFDEL